MAEVRYEGATRIYPGTEVPAVNALDLDIADGHNTADSALVPVGIRAVVEGRIGGHALQSLGIGRSGFAWRPGIIRNPLRDRRPF